MKALILITLIVGLVSAASFVESMLDNWVMYSLLALIISTLITVVVFYVGRLLGNRMMEMTFKMELVEIFVNVLIILSISMLFSLSNIYFNLLGSQCSGNCMYEQSISVLNDLSTIFFNLMNDYTSSALTSNPFRVIQSFGFGMGAQPYIDLNFGVSHYTQKFMQELNNRMELLSLATYPLFGIKAYIENFAYPLGMFLIVFGVFLRSFMYARRAGATLIALGIGSAYILPALVILFMGGVTIDTSNTPHGTCPYQCSNHPIGFTDDGSPVFIDDLVSLGVSNDDIQSMINGSVESIAVEDSGSQDSGTPSTRANINPGGGTVPPHGHIAGVIHSCQYYALLKDNPSLKSSIIDGEDQNTIFWSCNEMCRNIPYSSDTPMCRDGETACKHLFDVSEGACFSPMYNDASLLQTQLSKEVLFNGKTDELGYAMGAAPCLYIKPSRVPTKADVDVFCPSRCRHYVVSNDNGLTIKGACEGMYDCDAIYSSNPVDISDVESIINKLSSKQYAEALEVWTDSDIPLDVYVAYGCENISGVLKEDVEFPYSLDCSGCASPQIVRMDEKDNLLAYLLVRAYVGGAMVLATLAIIISAISNSLGGEVFIPALHHLL